MRTEGGWRKTAAILARMLLPLPLLGASAPRAGYSAFGQSATVEPTQSRPLLKSTPSYGARGALALTRLSRAQDGRIAWRMKRPLPDGTTHLYFTG